MWGISTLGYGVIAEGVASIRQCIDIIVRTTKGTDPLRPEFGSEVHKYVDKNLGFSIPNTKRAIIEAVAMWEPRIKLLKVNHIVEGKHCENPQYELTYKIIDEDLIDKLVLDIKNGIKVDGVNELILQAFFPPNPNNYRYTIKLIINGQHALPMPDPKCLSTIQDMFNWVQANWFFLGKWHLLNDRIVCYMNAAGITSASLSISVLPIVYFSYPFPQLGTDEFYSIEFKANGNDATPLMPQTFKTPGEVLSWVQNNWSAYANWFVQYELNNNTVFSDEFSFEFDVPFTGYTLIGVSNVEGFEGVLTITTV